MDNNNGWPISWEDVKNRLEALESGGSGGSGAGYINYTGGIEIDGLYMRFTDLTAEYGISPGDEIEIGLCMGYSTCESDIGSYKLNFIINDGYDYGGVYPINGCVAENFDDNESGFFLRRPNGGATTKNCWTLERTGSDVTFGEGNSDYQVMFVRIYKANA